MSDKPPHEALRELMAAMDGVDVQIGGGERTIRNFTDALTTARASLGAGPDWWAVLEHNNAGYTSVLPFETEWLAKDYAEDDHGDDTEREVVSMYFHHAPPPDPQPETSTEREDQE